MSETNPKKPEASHEEKTEKWDFFKAENVRIILIIAALLFMLVTGFLEKALEVLTKYIMVIAVGIVSWLLWQKMQQNHKQEMADKHVVKNNHENVNMEKGGTYNNEITAEKPKFIENTQKGHVIGKDGTFNNNIKA